MTCQVPSSPDFSDLTDSRQPNTSAFTYSSSSTSNHFRHLCRRPRPTSSLCAQIEPSRIRFGSSAQSNAGPGYNCLSHLTSHSHHLDHTQHPWSDMSTRYTFALGASEDSRSMYLANESHIWVSRIGLWLWVQGLLIYSLHLFVPCGQRHYYAGWNMHYHNLTHIILDTIAHAQMPQFWSPPLLYNVNQQTATAAATAIATFEA